MHVRLLLLVVPTFLLVMDTRTDTQDHTMRKIQPEIPCPSEWDLVHAEYGGEITKQAYVRFTHTRMTGNRLWVFAEVKNETVVHHQWAEYQLRPGARPAEIDFRDRCGIFEFDGEKLKVCLGAPGKSRPRSFTTVKGDERLLLLLIRQRSPQREDR